MAPAAMPAGGADLRQPQVRRRVGVVCHLHVASNVPLRLSPMAVAPSLSTLRAGTSLRLLRRWSAADGNNWLHVQPLGEDQPRGWLRA